ncbi:Protein of unknown function (DUF3181) [Leptolyngbyaceae cyanobacterium JSC-12]|nr:Protein of unknown function (DUF3181) [Leptolyngbyaceae cyanobacterium JSC-12]
MNRWFISTPDAEKSIMTNTSSSRAVESLAAEIGQSVYIDVAKWHLYLSDAHLHTVLAEQLYPLLANKELSEAKVQQILQSISVKLGGGKRELPLSDLVPMQCQVNLLDLLEEFQRNL